MSQTLTKPILLDETGQAIAGKLDTNSAAIIDALEDIKDAVSMGTDFVPVMIKVTTPPAKVSYMAGENLNLAGIVVSLIASNGVQIDVTDQCTFVPANGTVLTSADTSVSISYYWYKDDVTFTTNYPIGVKSLSSIAITTPPTQTEYITGETLDLTGIIVTATYDDGTFLDVTQNCTFSPANGATLSMNNTTIVATYTEGGVSKTATTPITVVVPIYGAEWDGTASSAWVRTDLAADFDDPNPYYASMTGSPTSPFDTIQPWAGMTKITDSGAGELVAIPKFYYKLTQTGNSIKIQIVPSQYSAWALENGYHISPAHMDRNDGNGERDTVYIGRYFCAGTNYKSETNNLPNRNSNLTTFRTEIHTIDSDIWQMDFAMLFTIWLLYIVELADWNSQNKIGYGCSTNGSLMVMGYTDSMPYHTGTIANTRTTFGGTQYRYIEGLWDNVSNWIDGCYYNNQKYLCIILNPNNFSNADNRSDGIATGVVTGTTQEPCPTQFTVNETVGAFPLFVPTASRSELNMGDYADEYSCDYWKSVVRTNLISFKTYYKAKNQGSFGCGLFSMNYKSYDVASSDVGARLMKLPNS